MKRAEWKFTEPFDGKVEYVVTCINKAENGYTHASSGLIDYQHLHAIEEAIRDNTAEDAIQYECAVRYGKEVMYE